MGPQKDNSDCESPRGCLWFLWRVLLASVQAAIYVGVLKYSAGNWEFWSWCSNSAYVDCKSPANQFYESNVTKLKVIAPSIGQTGTTTVIMALRELGWTRAYHADDFGVTAKLMMMDNIHPITWANTVSRCRMSAISLEPIFDLLPMTLDASPDAKVILTWRDYKKWQKSTSEGGQVKDRRAAYIIQLITKSKTVFPYVELFDHYTGIFERWRLDGAPPLEKPDMIGYMYRTMCNGYAWPVNDVYNRGTYKVYGQEEAYLAHIDEIRRLTPPDRLLVKDVKKLTWQDLEQFLGLPPSGWTHPLPRSRSSDLRMNDPWVGHHRDITYPVFAIFFALHAVSFLICCTLPVSLAAFLLCCCCTWLAAQFPSTPASGAVALEPLPAHLKKLASPPGKASGRSQAEERYERALAACPVVAILRGVVPSEVLAVGKALVEAGVTIIEVPLNSPNALESIRILAQGLPESIVVGAGTVLTEEQVWRVAEVGGTVIVSPDMKPAVISATRRMGLVSLPGVATVTEAFAALSHGASGLKAFPGECLPPAVLKAWRAVLPKSADILAVGGVTADNMAEYWSAGVSGFGVGSALFRPGDDADTVRKRATAFVAACRKRG